MLRRRSSLSGAFAAALLCLAAACHADGTASPDETQARDELGLMGTIPIYWGEADGFGELLAGDGASHWARAQIESGYRIRPIDALSGESLAGIDFLMLAQPRALSPAENVALDSWVREGGQLLLFADPMLTGESRFPIGDRRRPQDVILLSPILDHWGLALMFDDEQPAGVALVASAVAPIPVNLPGTLEVRAGGAGCAILAAPVLARCDIGQGRATIVADAALLDQQGPHPGAARALDGLLDAAFSDDGESAGNAPDL